MRKLRMVLLISLVLVIAAATKSNSRDERGPDLSGKWPTTLTANVLQPHALAQDKPKPHVEAAVIAARPADVSSIEAIVKTDYECVSGGIGVARQWARDFSLYDPFARSFVPSKDEKTGALVIWHPTQQEYADESDAQLVRDGFSEHEVAHKIYKYGNVATVFSSYEVSMERTGKLYSRGVNIYQLYYAGSRWWISSVSWDAENNINPIPPELMPKN